MVNLNQDETLLFINCKRKSPQMNCELLVVRPGFEPEFPP